MRRFIIGVLSTVFAALGSSSADDAIYIPSTNLSAAVGTLPVDSGGTGVTSLSLMERVRINSVQRDATNNCANPAQTTINSGPVVRVINCGALDTATIYFDTKLPDNYDGGAFVVGIQALDPTGTGALAGDVAAFCMNTLGDMGANWGSESTLDVVLAVTNDLVFANSDSLVAGGDTCAAGSHIFVRYQVDAGGTTTGTSLIIGFTLAYEVTDADQSD